MCQAVIRHMIATADDHGIQSAKDHRATITKRLDAAGIIRLVTQFDPVLLDLLREISGTIREKDKSPRDGQVSRESVVELENPALIVHPGEIHGMLVRIP